MHRPIILLRIISLQFLVLLLLSIPASDSYTIPQDNSRRKESRVGPEGRLTVTEWDSYNHQQPEGPGTYAFGYSIDDAPTGNTQFREEERHPNGTVTGSYGYIEPDGNVHTVYYVADERGYRVRIENSHQYRRQKIQGVSTNPTKTVSDNRKIVAPKPHIISQSKNQQRPLPINGGFENKFNPTISPAITIQNPSPVKYIHNPLYPNYNRPISQIVQPLNNIATNNAVYIQKPYRDQPIQQVHAQYVVPFTQKQVFPQNVNNFQRPFVYNTPQVIEPSQLPLKRKDNNALSYNMYFVPNTQYLNLIK